MSASSMKLIMAVLATLVACGKVSSMNDTTLGATLRQVE